jgi:hypothetical protein
MFMSSDRNLGKNHNVNMTNKSFQNISKFRYLGTTVTNQNCSHEGRVSRLIRGMLQFVTIGLHFCCPKAKTLECTRM